MFFWLFFFLILIIYFLFIAIASYGWIRLNRFIPDKPVQNNIFLSLIIAVRNEENILPELLSSLHRLKYPDLFYEVVFVDDHSEDNTYSILKKESELNTSFKTIHLGNNKSGKKEAIKEGVFKAKGELCILTDADCRFNPEWLDHLSSFYIASGKPSLIIGLVDYFPAKGVLNDLFRLEFLSLVITGAGLATNRIPVFCNGANLAVKRNDFIELAELNENHASGDDVFLLHALKKNNRPIKVIKSVESLVETKPPEGIRDFLQQRIRWASKAKSYHDIPSLILAIIVFLSSLNLIIATLAGVYQNYFKFLFWGFLLKISADIILFISGSRFLKLFKILYLIPFMELIYPFYILFTTLTGIKKPFTWKGRMVK